MKTIKKFSRIVKLVLAHPGIRQNMIVQLTSYPRVDVSRLCKSAEEERWIKKVGSGYIPGEYVIEYMRGGI